MAKYIDADLLRKEIKKNEKAAHKSALGCADNETRKFHEGKDFVYQYVGILIDSLQQEQPDCHTVEDWIQHIKNADQLTKDIFSKGPYDVLYDALNYPYRHCYDAIKEFGELCFQVGINSVKQKQPDVDLNELTIKDLELLHTFLYAVKNNKQGAFTFTRLSDEQYNEVLRRFNKAKEERK